MVDISITPVRPDGLAEKLPGPTAKVPLQAVSYNVGIKSIGTDASVAGLQHGASRVLQNFDAELRSWALGAASPSSPLARAAIGGWGWL